VEIKNFTLTKSGNGRSGGSFHVRQRACLLAVLAGGLVLSGCDTRDVSMQVELASLREKIRKAEAERDLAAKDKTEAEQSLERGSLLPVATLKDGLGKAMKSLEQNAIAAFPGYRPAPGKAGRIFYAYETTDPYRSTLELNLVPISGSALTPELPKVAVEIRAGSDGVWQVPGQSTLRELQAAAVAKTSADRRAPAEPPASAPPQKRPQQAVQQPAQPPGGSARVIDWGDSQSSSGERQPAPEQPASRKPQPSGNAPHATESHEIRFNN